MNQFAKQSENSFIEEASVDVSETICLTPDQLAMVGGGECVVNAL